MAVFYIECLRRMCPRFWPNKCPIIKLSKNSGCTNRFHEVRLMPLRWLRYALKKPQDIIGKVSLRWTPLGKRQRQAQAYTWKKSCAGRADGNGRPWHARAQAQVAAKNERVGVGPCSPVSHMYGMTRVD